MNRFLRRNDLEKITPCLWCNNNLEEMVDFYKSIFPETEVLNVARSTGGPVPAGQVLTMTFRLNGLELMGINGGPYFTFSEAISFYVSCKTQDEVDHYWDKLTAGGGAPGQCGWLKDKFGLSWQIVPTALGELLQGPDRERAGRTMKAMLAMKKLDIAALKAA
jgi:predicted 3-demethylubiquinone-9 3-methyltransferase (glyoxalase superfamily)